MLRDVLTDIEEGNFMQVKGTVREMPRMDLGYFQKNEE